MKVCSSVNTEKMNQSAIVNNSNSINNVTAATNNNDKCKNLKHC